MPQSFEQLAEFAWWKVFYFIFQKPIKLTSVADFDDFKFKHTNINLTTEIGSDLLICHVLKTFTWYVSPKMIINYNYFEHDCALCCVYKYV